MPNKQFWSSKTFRFWYTCYLAVMLLPTLFCVVFFHFTSNILRKNAYDAGQTAIKQVRDIADGYLSQICAVSDTVYVSSDIQRIRYVKLPFTAAKYFELHQRAKVLYNFNAQWELLTNLFLYQRDLDCLLDAGHIYTHINQMDKAIHDWIGLTDEAFAASMNQHYVHHFRFVNQGSRILYMRTLAERMDAEKTPVLTLIIVINTNQLDRILQSTGENNGGNAYILLPDGQVYGTPQAGDPLEYESLSSKTSQDWIRSSGYVVTYADSSVSNMRYVLSVPCDSFMAGINHIQKVFFGCLCAMLLLGIGIAYVLASRCYRPLHQLKQTVKIPDKKDQNDDFAMLSDRLTHLRDSEEQLRFEVERLNKIASARLFHLLISGNIKEISRQQEERMKDFFTGTFFIAALIAVQGSSREDESGLAMQEDIASVMLNKIAYEFCKGICKCAIRREDGDYAAVFCFPANRTMDELQPMVQDICVRLHERALQLLNITSIIYIGDAVDDVKKVGESYKHARQLRDYAELADLAGRHVLLYDKEMFSPHISWRDYDIVDAERRFVNLMLEGNYASGEKALQEIFSYYSFYDGMSLYVMRCRMFGMMNMMINVLHDVEPDINAMFYEETNPIETLLSAGTMQELKSAMFGIINQLIGQQENHSANIRDKLSQVENFVERHYFDPNLSVQQIADTFEVSLPYLSRMFKQERGVGLLDYINRCRVKKAKRLIQSDEHMTIGEVAQRVGYGSSQSFIRIFKRYEGVTPGSIRTAEGDGAENKNGEPQSQTGIID